MQRLRRAAWPGNVRELRNTIERSLVLEQEPLLAEGGELGNAPVDLSVPYEEARQRALAEFERRYLTAQLEVHHGNVSRPRAPPASAASTCTACSDAVGCADTRARSLLPRRTRSSTPC